MNTEIILLDRDIDLELLQQTADYRSFRKMVRFSIVFGFLVGIVCVICGFFALKLTFFGLFYITVGVMLFCMAIWMIISSNPKTLIIEGMSLLALGTVFILSAIIKAYLIAKHVHTFNNIGGLILWGVMINAVGGRSIGSYRRFSELKGTKPAKDHLKEVDELVKRVKRADTKEGFLEFRYKTFTTSGKWKGMLSKDYVVLVKSGEQDIFVDKKENIEIRMTDPVKKKGMSKALLRVGKHSLKIRISLESYAKYERWKAAIE